MKKTIYLIVALTTLIVSGCSSDYFETTNNPLSYGESYIDITISTDKALYNPGETVKFIAKGIPDGAKVRYTYLGNVISETDLSTETWSWTTPNDDYRGYMVEIYTIENGVEKLINNIAVDVSYMQQSAPNYHVI